MRLGSAWTARTCSGNKHLKPHLYRDKALCWQLSTIAKHAAEVSFQTPFQSKPNENCAILKKIFNILLERNDSIRDAHYIYMYIYMYIHIYENF